MTDNDFKRRMRDAKQAREARNDFNKAEKARVAKLRFPKEATHRTGRFKVAKAFRPGHGRYS